MNFNLTHELLLGASLCQCGFGNYFSGRDTLVLKVGELKAASETSLTKELSFEILFDANFTVIFDDFLVDNSLGIVDVLFLCHAAFWH